LKFLHYLQHARLGTSNRKGALGIRELLVPFTSEIRVRMGRDVITSFASAARASLKHFHPERVSVARKIGIRGTALQTGRRVEWAASSTDPVRLTPTSAPARARSPWRW